MKALEENFNNVHPEMNDNETFIGNMSVYDFSRLIYRWKTARAGHIAYTRNGMVVKSIVKLVPVFVSKEEFENSK